jgi:hypothetical protein
MSYYLPKIFFIVWGACYLVFLIGTVGTFYYVWYRFSVLGRILAVLAACIFFFGSWYYSTLQK